MTSGRRLRSYYNRGGGPAEEVVPGDVIELKPGTVVAADARLIEADLPSVDESALTGEFLPVPGGTRLRRMRSCRSRTWSNLLFMGTTVAGGSGRALVVATGAHTQMGLISAMAGGHRAPPTPLQRQLEGLGRKLVTLSLGVWARLGHRPTPWLRPGHDQVLDLARDRRCSRRFAYGRDDHLALGIGAMRLQGADLDS